MESRIDQVLWDVKEYLELEEVSVEGLISVIDDVCTFDYDDWEEFRSNEEYFDWLKENLTK